ncbi:flagellar protein FlaR [Oleiharenicola lentus]|uniref:Flagellar protein FlaR n=1 Tax=Oleiharenicola lentus TaxID=2508720 RepID=A0A4Q1C8V6_9BACT|nr:flagellar protein FlaR [Oleiharenicola lentus]RXK55394.1 flagellar protein FlaR [Oleiharenicola lentus]
MTRIAVIGNAGGGKSTLSRRLRDALRLPLHPVDQLQWRPGWKRVAAEEFATVHAKLVSEPRWIIDGWGEFDAIEARFRRCDTVVLIDFPLWRHYWWALKRQFMCLFRPRIDGPSGCPMLPMTWPLMKMLWLIDRDAMPRLRALVDAQRESRRVIVIRSLAELRQFNREVDAHAKTA